MLDNMKQVSGLIRSIEDKLVDELSRDVFYARLKYLMYNDLSTFRNDILDIGDKNHWQWEILQMDRWEGRKASDMKGIVIWGGGVDGKYTYRLLKQSNYKNLPILFVDNDSTLWGKEVLGCKVISPQELQINYRDYVCVVGSGNYRHVIYDQLIWEGFPLSNIVFVAHYGVLCAVCGWQYFDCFQPNEGEIFCDCGMMDGETSADFVKWCNGNYEALYGFEANPYFLERCRKRYSAPGMHDATIIEKCLWNKKDKLSFSKTYGGSGRLCDSGELVVDTDTMDNVLEGKRVSFIKMDIEGAEFAALEGAKQTIQKHHPRMALSVYHKPGDILEIPSLILDIDDSYRFALRHYCSLGTETVLYAY